MSNELLNDYQIYNDVIDGADRLILPVVMSDTEREEIIDNQLELVLNPERNFLLAAAIKNASPLLSNNSEATLRDLAEATETDQMLRISFWEEVGLCLKGNKQLTESNIYNGTCNANYWAKLKTPAMATKLAYILTPVKEYAKMNKVLLAQGQQILLDILNANPYVGTGKEKRLDSRIAKVQLEAYRLVEERIYGKAVQRVQTHNTNVEDNKKPDHDVEALKAEIKALEATHMDLLTVGDLSLDSAEVV